MHTRQRAIAVIDDDESLCRALGRVLNASGFDVRTYHSAEAFLGDPLRSATDLIVLDNCLQGMSGLELQAKLSAQDDAPPVVLVTAHDESGIREEALTSGCAAFLRKPFPMSELLAVIDRYLA